MRRRILSMILAIAFISGGTGLIKVQASDENSITRFEAAVMITTLLGQNESGQSSDESPRHPFDDVQIGYHWAVNYLYENKIVFGISETKFGGEYECSYEMVVVMILRALGYSESGGDFMYGEMTMNVEDAWVKINTVDNRIKDLIYLEEYFEIAEDINLLVPLRKIIEEICLNAQLLNLKAGGTLRH